MNITGVPAAAGAAAGATAKDDDLRRACVQLEAVFLQELMKALRETVPESGLADGGAGEDIFSSMLDAQLTETMAQRLERGLAASLYRQLRGPAEGAAAAGPLNVIAPADDTRMHGIDAPPTRSA